MTIGIYCLEFSDGSKYIGQSNNIERRIGEHMEDMNGVHKNRKIRAAVFSCGLPNWYILEECSLFTLNAREIHWISTLDTFRNGLNLTIGGGYARKGVSHNPISVQETSSAFPVKILIGSIIMGMVALFIWTPILIPMLVIGAWFCLR